MSKLRKEPEFLIVVTETKEELRESPVPLPEGFHYLGRGDEVTGEFYFMTKNTKGHWMKLRFILRELCGKKRRAILWKKAFEEFHGVDIHVDRKDTAIKFFYAKLDQKACFDLLESLEALPFPVPAEEDLRSSWSDLSPPSPVYSPTAPIVAPAPISEIWWESKAESGSESGSKKHKK